jgi:hypothetical protein
MPADDLPLRRVPGAGHMDVSSLERCPGHAGMLRCGGAARDAPQPSGAAEATALPLRRVRGATLPAAPIRMDPAPGEHILRRVLDGLNRI